MVTNYVYFLCLFTSVIILPLVISYDKYYIISSVADTVTDGEQICNEYGKHLASIHTILQNYNAIAVSNTHQCDACWIGLNVNSINNITTMEWMDKTNVETSLIDELWCDGYPIIDNNTINTIHYTYMDRNGSCWKSTSNSSLQICVMCGPKMFDNSGLYWIANLYVPIICGSILLLYSLYSIIYLLYHLYKFEHNWILSPSKNIKRTAILIPCMMAIWTTLLIIYSILLYVAWKQTGIMPPPHPLDPAYPDIYQPTAYIGTLILAILYIYVPLGYIHLLYRLQHTFDNVPYMQQIKLCGISWQCCYKLIIILIIIYFMVAPGVEIVNVTVSSANIDSKDSIKAIIITLGIVADLSINTFLSSLYIKGLHEYSNKHYFRMDVAKNDINADTGDSRRHELMVEAARYTVLFSFVWILNFIGFIGVAIFYVVERQYFETNDTWRVHDIFWNVSTMLVIIALCLKEIALLISIRLSFKFSHKRYEKLCKKCDEYIKKCCHNISKTKDLNIIKQIEIQQNSKKKGLNQPLLS